MERKLAAILHADVAGFSRLTGDDEEGTLHTLKDRLGALKAAIEGHGGRVVNTAGDAVLAEFTSVVAAVGCAVAAQRDLAARDQGLDNDRKLRFRIGVNLGDVMVDGNEIYGNGVNVAARLETLADPGGICISGRVLDQVEDKLDVGFAYLGEHTVKNINNQVKAFAVLLDPAEAGKVAGVRSRGPVWPWLLLALLIWLLVAGGGFLWWRTWETDREPATTGTSTPRLSAKPSVAVLPFADGMTDDLITDLSKVSGLFVIARKSGFTHKRKAGFPE